MFMDLIPAFLCILLYILRHPTSRDTQSKLLTNFALFFPFFEDLSRFNLIITVHLKNHYIVISKTFLF